MESSRLLTLLSDFGLSDPYVGVMKGTIAQVNPALTVIDLTHQISPHSIALARFALMTAYPYFPPGTVHIAVVDPGVGSTRRAIAIALGDAMTQPTGFLVGPDNGIFSGVLMMHPVLAVVELTNHCYWRTPVPSATFHGRDIFAAVGAHLASGVSLDQLGQRIAPDTLVRLDVPIYQRDESQREESQREEHKAGMQATDRSLAIDPPFAKLTGCIQAIDHFGNLITNIPGTQVVGQSWSLRVSNVTVPGRETYSNNQAGALLALVGSHGWIEIAVNGGSAQARLKLDQDAACLVEVVVGC